MMDKGNPVSLANKISLVSRSKDGSMGVQVEMMKEAKGVL
jgi:hypothetical protein